MYNGILVDSNWDLINGLEPNDASLLPYLLAGKFECTCS